MDRYLDQAGSGPLFLKPPELAKLVVDCLETGVSLGHYELGAFVIMANHIHVLLLPQIPPSRLLQSIKGSTACRANQMLGRTGQPFWQGESYDHWVREATEYGRIAAYIENNPVQAGLVRRAEDYLWSSAASRSLDRIVERQPGVAAPQE